jgi:hypothetical protein
MSHPIDCAFMHHTLFLVSKYVASYFNGFHYGS